jgi:hypothetical protein
MTFESVRIRTRPNFDVVLQPLGLRRNTLKTLSEPESFRFDTCLIIAQFKPDRLDYY